jgi:hypothetical protein
VILEIVSNLNFEGSNAAFSAIPDTRHPTPDTRNSSLSSSRIGRPYVFVKL